MKSGKENPGSWGLDHHEKKGNKRLTHTTATESNPRKETRKGLENLGGVLSPGKQRCARRKDSDDFSKVPS